MTRRLPADRRPVGAATAGALGLASGLLAVAYAAFAVLAPLPAVPAITQPLSQFNTSAAVVSLPGYGAVAIGAADGEQIYAGIDLDTSRPIASITKVVTALVVLDAHPIADGEPGQTLTMTDADSRLPARYAALQGTVAPAPAGSTITQRQVIELMLVHSANNYAETLAVWAFGSVDGYLAAARTWLDQHGLTTISVADTTGFSPLNVATPRALIELARLAHADTVVSEAAALPSVTVPGVGSYLNRNLIVGVDGVTGLKTGTLDEAGACLLFSADHEVDGDTITVVGVVLDGPDHARVAADVRALLASIRDDYHRVTVATAGDVVARYDTPWGESVTLSVAETVDDLVWGSVQSSATVTAPTLQPGLTPPRVPMLSLRYGGVTTRIALEWSSTLRGPDLEWRLIRPLAELFGD